MATVSWPVRGRALRPLATDRRVCVWFGEHLILDYVADLESAAAYETAMRQRFSSLRVTNEPAKPANEHNPALSAAERTARRGQCVPASPTRTFASDQGGAKRDV